MKKIFSLLFIEAIIVISATGQTFRSGFDKYEFAAGGQGKGFSYYSNVRNQLTAEGVYMESYLTMFKATKDKRDLDKFIIHSKRVQERRDDNIKNIALLLQTPMMEDLFFK